MNKFRTYYYKSLSFITGLIILMAFISEFLGGRNLAESITNPYLYGLFVFSIITWLLLILLTFTFLLLNPKERETAFLIMSNTEVRDELEQRALNDSIKSTFILNIIILGLVYLLSGVKISTDFSSLDEKKKHISLVLELPPKNPMQVKVKNHEDDSEAHIQSHLNEKNLVPQSLYSPNGLFILILIQFLALKLFLFLNKRALQ